MPKVTTVVDVKVVMEMTVEEARVLHEVLGKEPGRGITWALFSPLHDVLNDLPTKGVE